MNKTVLTLALVCAVQTAAMSAETQSGGKGDAQATGSITSYDRDYFSQFSVITADDLLRRIPGVQDLLTAPSTSTTGTAVNAGQQQAVRGFGSTGAPILFNGRRLSGKSNDPITALQRIQARQVVRVDLITGSVPGLDIRVGNQGAIVNVILDETVSTGYGSWEVSANYFSTGDWEPGGATSYAGSFGAFGYTVSAKVAPRNAGRNTNDIYVLPPATDPFGQIFLVNATVGTDYILTGGLSYQFAADTINLNARYATEDRVMTQPIDSYAIVAPSTNLYTGSSRLTQDYEGDLEWEVGGDYEHAWENGDTLRALFVVLTDDRPSDAKFATQLSGQQERLSFQQIINSHRTERIVRGYYNAQLGGGQAFELGSEVAVNALQQQTRRLEPAINGDIVDVPLFNSDAKVSELRLESFSRYTWEISRALYIEGAIDTELSRLRQRGVDVNTSRKFFFVKPRFDARYDINPLTQIRGRLVRTISQLDFANFVSTVSTNDVRIGVVQAGNPNLVPEKTWTAESTFQRKLPRNQGVVSVRAFYNDISDAIDKIPILPNVAGTGNIGDASSYGAETKLALRLDWIGLPRATLDASATIQESSATDAFTGEKRPLQTFQNYLWSVSFRHDTSWRGLSYGLTVNGNDARYGSDIDYTESFLFKPVGQAFIEIPAGKLTLRLEGKQLFQVVTRDRLLYSGNRAIADISRRELRRDRFFSQ